MITAPTDTAFRLDTALDCARFAQAAYGLKTRNQEQGTRNTNWITNARTGTQVLVAWDRDVIVVAFRGTEPTQREDWITDLKFRRCEGVHRGFLAAWQSVRDDVERQIRRVRDRHQMLVITGHSLGGALAVLCARNLMDAFNTAPRLYTFGQPRIFNDVMARKVAANLPYWYRVVNEEDIVPRLPLWCMGYRHAGTEVFLPSFGGATLNPPLHYKLLSDLWGIIDSWSRKRLAVAADHGIARYVTRLESLTR